MRAGDVVWNPLTGEKAMLVESAEESGGARIVTDLAVEAGGFVPGGEHYRQPPDAVQRLLLPPLAALARRRGVERTVDRYLDLETHPSAEAGLGRLPEQVMRRADGRG